MEKKTTEQGQSIRNTREALKRLSLGLALRGGASCLACARPSVYPQPAKKKFNYWTHKMKNKLMMLELETVVKRAHYLSKPF